MPGTPPLKVFLGCAGTDHAAFFLNSFTISATQRTPPGAGNTAWSAVLPSTLNSRTHALNGNTVLRLAFQEGVLTGRLGLSLGDCIPTPALPTYPRDWLLQAPCHTQDPRGHYPPVKPLQTTPLPLTHKPQSSKRSGRRVHFITPEGKYSSYRSRKGRRPHRPHRNSRIKNSHLVLSRTPPPRGVPGTHRVNEERTPTQGGANVVTRGTSRRTRRRAYRAWRRCHKQGLDQGADSPEPPRLESTKATPKRSKWFQQTLHWQEGATRRKKPLTPPLSYNSKLRIGALNVQGMADTLKVTKPEVPLTIPICRSNTSWCYLETIGISMREWGLSYTPSSDRTS